MVKKAIGEFTSIYKGSKVNNISYQVSENAKRYIQIDDLRNNNNMKYTSDAGFEAIENDILIAWDGANAGTIGYGISGIIGSTIAALRIEDNQIYVPYVGKFLQHSTTYLRANTNGATIPHIRRDILENLRIPFPDSYNEQKRISDLIDKASYLVKKRQETIRLADEFLRSTFLEMFGDPYRNPLNWEKMRLEDVILSVTDGKHGDCRDLDNSGYYFLSAKDIRNDEICLKNARQIYKEDFEEVHRRTNVKPGDLLIVNTGATIGKSVIVHNDVPSITLQKSVAIIKVNELSITTEYLFYLLKIGLKTLSTLSSGSAQKNLLLSQIRNIKLPIPPIAAQKKFSNLYREVNSIKKKYEYNKNLFENLFGSLMSKAFRGDL
jgi:type I restriction enzyme S subunit